MKRSHLRTLQDQHAELSDKWSFLCEIFGDVLTGDIVLSKKGSNGLACFAHAMSSQIESFSERFNVLDKTALQRFSSLVEQSDVMSRYYNASKQMIRVEKVWKEFKTLSRREQTLITFMFLVWNPIEHRYPHLKEFSVLRDAQHLLPEDKHMISKWLEDPFLVMDAKGNIDK